MLPALSPPVQTQATSTLAVRVRMATAGAAAVALSLPIAWISLSKLLVFCIVLGLLIVGLRQREQQHTLRRLLSLRWVLAILALFAFSLFWTVADAEVALAALTKHSKLLLPFLLVLLIRSVHEARVALILFGLAQSVLACLSWASAAGLTLPWLAARGWGWTPGIVFTSYLDQSIIFSVTAAVLWHLRRENLWPAWLGLAMAVAMLANVLVLLPGRTGYLIAILVLTLVAVWALPKRWQWPAVLLVPILMMTSLWFGSSKIQARIALVAAESRAFISNAEVGSSAAFRLNAWRRSWQAIAEQPLTGHGVGAWTGVVKRLEGANGTAVFGSGKLSNPHQEFMLWGVELGLLGLLLLPAWIVALLRDFVRFKAPVAHAGISVTLAMAVACLFNSSLFDGLIGDYFCVLLGLLLAYGLTAPNQTKSLSPSIA